MQYKCFFAGKITIYRRREKEYGPKKLDHIKNFILN